MLSKFSISTVAIAALLTLSHAAIAAAEVYKTSKGQVVVTGLTAKQKYPIKAVNAKNKPVTRKDLSANTCGEVLVDGASKYKSLTVGTEAIDPATLTVKEHPKCAAKKTAAAPTKKGTKKATKKAPAATSTTTSPSTTIPATDTTGTMTAPATGTTTPTTAPATSK